VRRAGIVAAVLLLAAASAFAETATLPMTVDLRLVQGRFLPYDHDRPRVSFDRQDRPVLGLAGTWKKLRTAMDHDLSLRPRTPEWFAAVAAEAPGVVLPGFDDSAWATHEVPGVENVLPAVPEDPVGAELVDGGIYYRRHFTVPAQWQGRVVRLMALAIDYVADVWVNGTWVGCHEGGYAPFALDLSAALVYGGDNVIAIRVDAMPWGLRMDVLPNLFATDFMHYAGIVQDLYLDAAPAAHVVRADVLPLNARGDLDVAVVLENRGPSRRRLTATLSVALMDRDHPDYLVDPVAAHLAGEPAGLTGVAERAAVVDPGGVTLLSYDVAIDSPRLWTPATPDLYVLTVTLADETGVVDTFATQFGVRTVEVGAGGTMRLNGRPAFFPGMARHEDWPDTGRTAGGAAFSLSKIAADLQIIRDTNVWFLRSAHYPNHPGTYLLADRMGFAVWEEIPAWWINVVSVRNLLARGLALQMWREMIWDARNRPSVLLWSVANEPMWYLVFNLRQFVRALHDDLDENYPDGRLVTISLAADGAVLTGGSVADVDVVGWTMYYGVFYGEDITGETRAFLDERRAKHPDTPIIACEYGYWSGDDGAEEARQAEVAEKTLDAFLPLAAVDAAGQATGGYLAAVTWWCQFNWYRVQEPHNQTMGLMHMDRVTAKPVHAVVKARYAPYFLTGGLADPVADDDAGDDDDDSDDDARVTIKDHQGTDDACGCG
jgi:beta-glucuronidase